MLKIPFFLFVRWNIFIVNVRPNKSNYLEMIWPAYHLSSTRRTLKIKQFFILLKSQWHARICSLQWNKTPIVNNKEKSRTHCESPFPSAEFRHRRHSTSLLFVETLIRIPLWISVALFLFRTVCPVYIHRTRANEKAVLRKYSHIMIYSLCIIELLMQHIIYDFFWLLHVSRTKSQLAASAMPLMHGEAHHYVEGRHIVEALPDESSYRPHGIIGINEQTSPQGPAALWSITALSSRMVHLIKPGNFWGGKNGCADILS